MFDFEKLEVYQKAKELNKEVQLLLRSHKRVDSYLRNQLGRASISMVINIAEGSGKFSPGDKRNFYTISRGSVYEWGHSSQKISKVQTQDLTPLPMTPLPKMLKPGSRKCSASRV